VLLLFLFLGGKYKMKVTTAQIKEIISGAVRMEERDKMVFFYRFAKEQELSENYTTATFPLK